MQRESLRNKKDIKSINNQEEKVFTCVENNFITRKRLNNYTRIIIWLHPVKSLSRAGGWGRLPADFFSLKNLKSILQQTIIHS